VSEITTHAETSSAGQTGAVSSAEFDQEEIAEFGEADGHAVTVIGKMLVGFFFYSLLVMTVVAIWTGSGGHDPAPPPPAEHAAVDEE
jgi:hypothetical protein